MQSFSAFILCNGKYILLAITHRMSARRRKCVILIHTHCCCSSVHTVCLYSHSLSLCLFIHFLTLLLMHSYIQRTLPYFSLSFFLSFIYLFIYLFLFLSHLTHFILSLSVLSCTIPFIILSQMLSSTVQELFFFYTVKDDLYIYIYYYFYLSVYLYAHSYSIYICCANSLDDYTHSIYYALTNMHHRFC